MRGKRKEESIGSSLPRVWISLLVGEDGRWGLSDDIWVRIGLAGSSR